MGKLLIISATKDNVEVEEIELMLNNLLKPQK